MYEETKMFFNRRLLANVPDDLGLFLEIPFFSSSASKTVQTHGKMQSFRFFRQILNHPKFEILKSSSGQGNYGAKY